MEGVFGLILIIGFILWLINRNHEKHSMKSANPASRSQSTWYEDGEGRTKTARRYYGFSSYEGKQIKEVDPNTVWHSANSGVTISGIHITKGRIYVGNNLAAPNQPYIQDAALIRPQAKVASSSPDVNGELMDYWPSYSDIHPRCRLAYLQWLASERDDSDTYIGYVFLYFYGLERRLLVDASIYEFDEAKLEIDDLIQEVKRLRDVFHRNVSFRRYSTDLLDMVRLAHQPDSVLQEEITITPYRHSQILKVQLANAAMQGKPIPARHALAWLIGDPETRLRTPARRCEDEFYRLFELRYREQFGEGVIVKPNKSPLKLDDYCPASGTLDYADIKLEFTEEGVPDLTKLKKPVRVFRQIAEACMDDLDAYSRSLGRKSHKPGSLAVLSTLPHKLLEEKNNPKINQLKSWLDENVGEGVSVISASDLLDQWGDERPEKILKRDAEAISGLLQKLGYGIAPDVRFHGQKLSEDGFVVLYRGTMINGNDYTPTSDFVLTSLILQLGAFVGIADGSVDVSERRYLKSIIFENDALLSDEQKSLLALLEWRLVEKPSMAGLKEKINQFSKDERSSIGNILVRVVLADGRIAPEEIKKTEKLFKSLGLDSSNVIEILHSVQTSSPVTIAQQEQEEEFVIPEDTKHTPEIFTLDNDYIKLQQASTDRVQELLGTIFEDDEVPAEQPQKVEGLDENHNRLYKLLITREEWPVEEIQEQCKNLGLMFNGAIETINAWAIKCVESPLIDYTDVLFVDTELVEELA